jgi:L-seryl-tRNA(Ser) seleniumtransferase
MMTKLFREIPSVDLIIQEKSLANYSQEVVVRAARLVLSRLRSDIKSGSVTEIPDVVAAVTLEVENMTKCKLRRVVNATGIALHTNLGRAPLPKVAIDAVSEVASGYCNLEFDLKSGKRGGRLDGVRDALVQLVGCEDAVVVNNNAAAVLLALSAHAAGAEVVVSRGELVEIGGSFRIPEVLEMSGATMVEVGTTNRTRASDYNGAITDKTALLLRVHPSNFRISGFTERPSVSELAELGVPVLDDLGSGALISFSDEPVVSHALEAGATAVTFSGDKLLGGSQAGIICGSSAFVAKCRSHPLYRALRIDKLALAALEATLRLYVAGRAAEVPVVSMLTSGSEVSAENLLAALEAADISAEIVNDSTFTGGGALPDAPMETKAVVIQTAYPEALSTSLRLQSTPIIGRISKERFMIYPLTLIEGDLERVVSGLEVALMALTGKE